ncbi:MAG: DNA polymerase III subunit alpha [Alphaproteobacteria bacterium]|nr:DNA polymerase III subunit alpha [Alphaproteobacteria bacterium]
MSYADFVHLRVHSAFSLSEGAIKIGKMVEMVSNLRMPAVAITDTNNLFGSMEVSYACVGEGVQPIIGCQLSVHKNLNDDDKFKVKNKDGSDSDAGSVILLVQNKIGYANLIKLVSKAYLDEEIGSGTGGDPRIAVADLKKWNEGLIILTGGADGLVGQLIQQNKNDDAEKLLLDLADSYKGRLYIELMRHGLSDELKTEPVFLDFAYKHNIPLVATNEVFFASADMYDAHDALTCVSEGTYVIAEDRKRLTPEHRFKSTQEMTELFSDIPEAIQNTLIIAKRCAFMVEKAPPVLPPYEIEGGQSEAEFLTIKVREDLEKRLEVHVYKKGMNQKEKEEAAKPYLERLEYELGIIIQMGFPGYFLIVADFIQWSKEHDIPVGPGRGSGAGSVVAWALTITDLDPLRFSLLFERFLNPERVSMPDFDIDFCQDRREEVIHYVQKKYGFDKVAQIITFGMFKARAVLRDVGRVLQMPYPEVDRICKLIPNDPGANVTIEEAMKDEPELREMQRNDPAVKRMLDFGMKLEGLYRHASTHAAGVVIGDKPLDEIVPLYRDPRSDMPVTQFNMKWVESASLVKFDFLGLKTLTVIDLAVKLVKKSKDIDINISEISLDDRKAFDLLTRADSVGVFQLESQGMQDVLRNLKPDTLEDIIAVVALYRPGPMENIPSYIRRKHGEETPDYLHKTIEPILKETYGIMIYQEQVMQIAQFMAGYSLGDADLLRRAMGKKKKEEMDKQREIFVNGSVKNNINKDKAAEIFELMAKFANYGFNKSHAAAYALIAYQTAYLKAHHPVEFLAASMTLDMQNTDKLNVFKDELRHQKIEILTPDINKSEVTFSVENQCVRYALAAIKNVGKEAVASIVVEREANGEFKDITDFANRLDSKAINKRQMENLVRAGAFDCLEANRAKLFEGLGGILQSAGAAAKERMSVQDSLFGDADDYALKVELPNCLDWPVMEKLKQESEAIGFYLSAHPLDNYGDSLERLRIIKSYEIERSVSKAGSASLKLAGILNSKRELFSKSGKKFAFAEFSDNVGTFEMVFFSEVLNSSRELLESGKPLLVTVDAKRNDEGQVRMSASFVKSLDDAVASSSNGLIISLNEVEPIERIKEVISKDKAGRGKIYFIVNTGDEDVEIELDRSFAISGNTLSELNKIPGITEVREV